MTTRLRFESVSKRFGARVALDSLSLTVEAGEIVGFLGANGAGKTTAMQIAMGLLHADHGRGELLGQPFSRARAARARVGYVPDAPVFFAGSALDAVLLAARLNGSRSDVEHARILLRQLDLPAEGQDARRFSRGMQQRLALAQALVTRPELLVLDEPASALDPPGVGLVRALLEQARREGAAVFLSSHQLHEVSRIADRIAFLREGRLVHTGRLRELLEDRSTACVTLRGFTGSLPLSHATVELAPSVEAAPGDRVFRVAVAEQRAFLEAAWAAGAELVRVEREQSSLEALFAQDAAEPRPAQHGKEQA